MGRWKREALCPQSLCLKRSIYRLTEWLHSSRTMLSWDISDLQRDLDWALQFTLWELFPIFNLHSTVSYQRGSCNCPEITDPLYNTFSKQSTLNYRQEKWKKGKCGEGAQFKPLLKRRYCLNEAILLPSYKQTFKSQLVTLWSLYTDFGWCAPDICIPVCSGSGIGRVPAPPWLGDRLLFLPDIVMLLDVDLMKHHVFLFGINVSFHLHGNMSRKYREQETLLWSQTDEPIKTPAAQLTNTLCSLLGRNDSSLW